MYSRLIRGVYTVARRGRSRLSVWLTRLQYPDCTVEPGVRLGRNVRIKVTDGGHCYIGRHCVISDNCTLTVKGGRLLIGEHTFFGPGCVVCANQLINIGDHCLIAEYVTLRDQNHGISLPEQNADATDSVEPFSSQPMQCSPIHLGHNVWLGAKVSVLSGVAIGDNCVAAAHACVIKDVADRSLVAGIPARTVRSI